MDLIDRALPGFIRVHFATAPNRLRAKAWTANRWRIAPVRSVGATRRFPKTRDVMWNTRDFRASPFYLGSLRLSCPEEWCPSLYQSSPLHMVARLRHSKRGIRKQQFASTLSKSVKIGIDLRHATSLCCVFAGY